MRVSGFTRSGSTELGRYPSAVVAQKALITGGAGFIGSHLAELLLDEGWEVWALDDLSTGFAEFVPGDVLVWAHTMPVGSERQSMERHVAMTRTDVRV